MSDDAQVMADQPNEAGGQSDMVVELNPKESMSEMDVSPLDDGDFNGNLNNEIPAQVDKYLDFIDISSQGHMLLGSSNLTGRYWNGSVWYYDNPKLAPGVLEAKTGMETMGGASQGLFIKDTAAVVGQDGGILSFISINSRDGKVQMIPTAHAEDHSHSILSVNLTCDSRSVATSSIDCSIRLWDCETTAMVKNLNPAHGNQVSCVSPHPNNNQIFLSTSLDGNVLLWDLRCPRPASCVYRDYDDAPTSVTWVRDGEQYLVGTQSGKTHLRSTTIVTHSVHEIQVFNRPVYRLQRNKFKTNEIAACANETKVVVFEIDGEIIKPRYEDNRHVDFVRGLVWKDVSTLYSCGWDKAVYTHIV